MFSLLIYLPGKPFIIASKSLEKEKKKSNKIGITCNENFPFKLSSYYLGQSVVKMLMYFER